MRDVFIFFFLLLGGTQPAIYRKDFDNSSTENESRELNATKMLDRNTGDSRQLSKQLITAIYKKSRINPNRVDAAITSCLWFLGPNFTEGHKQMYNSHPIQASMN